MTTTFTIKATIHVQADNVREAMATVEDLLSDEDGFAAVDMLTVETIASAS